MTSTLQDRLNGVTDILSRVSKLVSEDLEKAVTTAVGHDREGDLSLGKMKLDPPSDGPHVFSCIVFGFQVLLRTRGQYSLWFPAPLLRATLLGRRASVLVSSKRHFITKDL